MTSRHLLLLLLAAGCSSAEAPRVAGAVRSGGFQYLALDQAGHRVLEGVLRLTAAGDSSFTGTWSIHWAAGADTTLSVGPQVGSGTLVGGRAGDHLYLDLNPGWADNNAVLLATPTATGFRGEWQWETITGPRTTGTFTATSN